jgi:hypothetical protein
MMMRSKVKWLLFVVANLAAFQALHAQSPSPFTIRGEAHDSSGQKISGARICAKPENSISGHLFPCVLTDADGKFLMRVDKAGKYTLISDKASDDFMSPNLPFFRHPAISVPEVVLDNANANPYVSINLGPKNGVLTGKSIDTVTDLPIENVLFTLCHAANPSVCFVISAKEGGGKFRVRAPHVPFTLKITADGFEDWIGLSGSDKPETAISVASGTTIELPVYLKRRKDATEKPLSETEKQVGLNLPAPAQLSPSDNSAFDYYPRKTKLEWEAVEGAVSYAVEIDYCRGGQRDKQKCVDAQPLAVTTNPPTTGILATTYEFEFVGAQPGRWRVWAIDKEGREGFKSPWRRFVYKQ